MTYRGIVKHGKIEVQPSPDLPDGTIVRVEPETDEWIERVKRLADRLTEATPPGASIVDELIKSRR